MEDHQVEVEPPIPQSFVDCKRGKKRSVCQEKNEAQQRAKQKAKLPSVNNEQPTSISDGNGCNCYEVRVCEFEHCVENHFRVMDTIAKLCREGDDGDDEIEETELQRFSSATIFLREWRYYNYDSKVIKFAFKTRNPEGKVDDIMVNLPQFSSAAVFKNGVPDRDTTSMGLRDFVMYVGGPVWALDWCPQVHERTDSRFKCEFIAVSAHPPGSSYHKIGTPLMGRGLVQIWCLVNVTENHEAVPTKAPQCTSRPKNKEALSDLSSQPKRPRGRPPGPKNNGASLDLPSQPKRRRGRLIKKRVEEPNDIMGDNYQSIRELSTEYPIGSSNLLETCGISKNSEDLPSQENSDKRHKNTSLEAPTCNFEHEVPVRKRRLEIKAVSTNHVDDLGTLSCTEKGKDGSAAIDLLPNAINKNSGEDPPICSNISNHALFEVSSIDSSVPKNVALPRLVLCLAHNGKVAWDLKWRPSRACLAKCQLRMGYLAALLGNGSLEVWEVPFPRVMKAVSSAFQGESTDPRFVKLEPVFKCSVLKCGNTQRHNLQGKAKILGFMQ